ncbi:S41 family peptidase [Sulfurisphaera javensis]|uniref:S41 family peptidase n=1 Tax=Sulfurisphaera javensis TaxID=2049879 RepID=A0AAT9GQ20_9CREN
MKGYYLYPDIRENYIAFTSDDDIWLYDGENAKRLTSGLGVAIRPKISPDKRKIAFTVLWLQNGKSGGDVFISDGNEARRVTYFNSPNSRVAFWLSSEEIIVISDYHHPFSTIAYKVNINTGEAKRLNYGLVSNIFIKDNIVVLARGYQDLPFWKGYKGGTKGELWISYDGGKKFEKFVSLDGIVSWPMIIDDRVYFLSDHEGIANLYSVNLKGEDLTKHTNFSTYCRNASSDGKRIVFQNMGDIYLFNPSTNETRKLDIEIITDRKKRQPKFVNVLDYLTEVDLNENYVSLVSRGKIFVMKPWEGPAIQLGEKQGVKYYAHQLLPDGSVIASDDEDNLLLLTLSGKKILKQNLGRIERIKVSPDGKKVLISNNRLELWLYDIEKDIVKLIDKSDYGRITDFDWHPNSEWFAYSFPEGPSTSSIKIGNINGNIVRITSPYGYDFSPSFDPDGRHLYFLSARHLEPSSDKRIFNMSFQKVVKPYLVVLSNTYSPFNPPFGKVEDKKGVEIQGIQDRVVPFPVDEDNYVKIEGSKNNKVFLFSYPIKGALSFMQDQTGRLEVFDLETKTKELYLDNVRDFIVYQSKILVALKDSLRIFDVSSKPDLSASGIKGGVVDISRVKVYVEPEKEWRQMLNETWKLMKQNYWNEKELKGWDEVLKKYEPLLDRVSTRYELGDIILEMQGETRTSHSYHTPYTYETQEPLPIKGLGAEFEYDESNNCFRVVKIYSGDPVNENEKSPLRDPGIQLDIGDCIISIDREPITFRQINYYLINKDQVTLEVLTKGGEKKIVYVKLMDDEKFLIYRSWVEENRRHVHEKTNGRVGYVHIPDMQYQGFSEFFRLFVSEFDKEGLIVDARFNRGGFISGLILQRLLLRRAGYVIPRNGKPVPEPYLSSPNVMVEVVNEYAGSDGDIFTYLFKKFKLGLVIGKRTWGGVIGISPRQRLVDKTTVTQPEFAVHFDDIGLGIENRGVDPDIEVEIPPGVEGDPQLDKAIEIIMKELNK